MSATTALVLLEKHAPVLAGGVPLEPAGSFIRCGDLVICRTTVLTFENFVYRQMLWKMPYAHHTFRPLYRSLTLYRGVGYSSTLTPVEVGCAPLKRQHAVGRKCSRCRVQISVCNLPAERLSELAPTLGPWPNLVGPPFAVRAPLSNS